MDHYFSEHPKAGSQESEFTATLRGHELHFITDRGVFSRGRLDAGSRLLIEVMDLAADDTILDLGCGYGAIGLFAARLAPRGRVFLVDINRRAADLAAANIAGNAIANATAMAGAGTDPVAGIAFNQILMNPPFRAGKSAVQTLLLAAFAALAPAGNLWVVAGTKQGAPSLYRFLAAAFGPVTRCARGGGYQVFRVAKAPGIAEFSR